MKKMKKTTVLVSVFLLLGILLAGCSKPADIEQTETKYPIKPITIIVPYSAGGSSDVGTRMVAKHMERELGQPVVIENLPGAGGWIGWDKLIKAEPDGYTLASLNLVFLTGYLNPEVKRDINLDSITALANHVWEPTCFAVNADSPFRDMNEVLAHVKDNPGKVKIAASGPHTQHHIAVLELERLGYKMEPVFTNGAADTLTMGLGGHVDIISIGTGEVKKSVEEGRIRGLAVLDSRRSKFVPEVPTFEEATGTSLKAYAARGFAGPANMEPAVVKTLEDVLDKILKDPEHIAEMESLGLDVLYMNSSDYKAFLKETEAVYKEGFGW